MKVAINKLTGIILAAGKQSRFNGNGQKALQTRKKQTILDINIKSLLKVCNRVCIVFNEYSDIEYMKIIKKYDHVHPIIIDDPRGTGDTLYKTIYAINKIFKIDNNDFGLLIWGDSIHISEDLFRQSINNIKNINDIIVPGEKQKHPYTGFLVNKNLNILNVLFSKRGDNTNIKGIYHDFSTFVFELNHTQKILSQFISENKYDDFDFLDIFNIKTLNVNGRILPISNLSSNNSYNTIEEFNNLIKNK